MFLYEVFSCFCLFSFFFFLLKLLTRKGIYHISFSIQHPVRDSVQSSWFNTVIDAINAQSFDVKFFNSKSNQINLIAKFKLTIDGDCKRAITSVSIFVSGAVDKGISTFQVV